MKYKAGDKLSLKPNEEQALVVATSKNLSVEGEQVIYTLKFHDGEELHYREVELDKLVSWVYARRDTPQQPKEQNHRTYNVGSSNYAEMNIQPWDVWKDWKLDPWDADIIKRISRTKKVEGKSFEESRIEDYEKIKHICDEKISQLKEKQNVK
jgi:hypothetical protein